MARAGLVIGFLMAAMCFAQSASRYPASWWIPVPENGTPDWEILPQSARYGEVVLSKRNELGILSNFAATPFAIDGSRYASVEGFWQMMLYPESDFDPRMTAPGVVWRYTREQVAQMTGFEAKQAGTLAEQNMQKLRIDWVTFEGRRMLYRSMKKEEHYRLIREAMQAKLKENTRVREVLLSTGNLMLRPDHIQEKNAPPEWSYFQIWMEIRTALQESGAKPSTASAQFFDEPKFTVAGVTENTYIGSHGSDTVMRSAEALAQATASLNKEASNVPNASQGALHHSLAVADEKQGRALDAVREYQRAAELDPSETNLFDWGTELLIHRAPEPAIEVFTQGIRLSPLSSRMLLGVAVALYAQGHYTQAARRFFEATDMHPADPGPYLFLGKTQRPEITGSPEYLDKLARFAKLQPENAWANYYYAIALWNVRKGPSDSSTLERVEGLLEQAVRLDPGLSAAYLQLGIIHEERQDLSAAIHAYRQAIEANPQLEQAHYRLAQACRQTGDLQQAHAETGIFQQLSKTSAQERDHERSSLQQFVVDLKTPAPN